MKRFLILIIALTFIIPNPSYAFFQKKDYKKIFLEDASKAEKRKDDKAAFFIYEKALFYYGDDKVVIESYAKFCEKRKYYNKAIILNQKLYDLTKDEYYLFKKYSLELKNDNIPQNKIKKILADKRLNASHRKDIHNKIILELFKKKDWEEIKTFCNKIPIKDMDAEALNACAIASEKFSDKKTAYKYYLRYHELSPKNSAIVKKILDIAEKFNDIETQEKFLKKFAELNPKDNGIKYRLAGFYEKRKEYAKARKIYEGLIASGDKSKHVLDSYAYVLNPSPKTTPAPATPPKIEYQYIPKKLTAYEKVEIQLYKALDNKNFKKAEEHINFLLTQTPKDKKLLELRLDIAMAQNDFEKALLYFKQTHKGALSQEEEKQLAFLYSKNDNLEKSIEIIEKLLQKDAENKELLNLALDYSMEAKNWDKAITHNEKLLAFNPLDEKLNKNQAGFYSIKKDFNSAIKYYEILLENYPKLEYKLELFNLNMATQNFRRAQSIIEAIYSENPNDETVAKMYLNSLLAQDRVYDALRLVQKHKLENTLEGSTVQGDVSMLIKDYDLANKFYLKALKFDKQNNSTKLKLAQSFRMKKELNEASKFYCDVLSKDPSNKEAMLGIGYLNIDQKFYPQARRVFRNILTTDNNYIPARIGIANSYNDNGDQLQTLSTLNTITANDEAQLFKAKTYYKMGMLSDAKRTLNGLVSKDAEDLRYNIRRDQGIIITPSYTLFNQQLAQNYDLDYNKVGINVSQATKNNLNVFADYNMYVYSSGDISATLPSNEVISNQLNNFTNEVRFGGMGRPKEKNEIRLDIGAKVFQFNLGAMLNTDSWIKHYFNDKFNLKAGFYRDNLEQSYLSAVGINTRDFVQNTDIIFGQVANNKTYLEYEYRFPHQFYSFGRGAFGVMRGQNIQSNPYWEGMLGLGRLMYNNPENNWINIINLDFVSYNSGYQYNLLNLTVPGDTKGNVFGGYFSPPYFSANTVNIKLEGKIKKTGFKYGLKGFGGAQFIMKSGAYTQSTATWGIAPYINYDFNDNVSINLAYNHFNYADIQRDIFTFKIICRGFKKRVKS